MALEIFDSGDLPEDNYARILVFGATGAGKSTLGSTMPGNRVVIAADPNASAPLARSLEEVPRIYTPKNASSRKPALFLRVKSWSDVNDACTMIEAQQAKRGLYSVVVDSLTAISEMCQAELLGVVPGKSAMMTDKRMTKQDFGTLFLRLDQLRHRLHKLPAHVLWLCGIKTIHTRPDDDKSPRVIAPDIIGQSSERFPANCIAALYLERRRGELGLRTRPDDDVNAKDNTGLLPPVAPADMELILAKMGYGHASVMDMPAIKTALKVAFPGQSAPKPGGDKKPIVVVKK